MEIVGFGVTMNHLLPMLLIPLWIADEGIFDLLMILALHLHRDRQPLYSLGSFDPVSVAPITARELHVVVEDELIYRGNHVEIPLPWNIVGLGYGYFFRHKNNPHSYPAIISE